MTTTTAPFLLADVALEAIPAGFSDLMPLPGVMLGAPTGKAYVLVGGLPWPGDAFSVLAGASPAAAIGDVIEYDVATSPSAFDVTVFQDGTFLINGGDNGTQQTFTYRLWRAATVTWAGPQTVTVESVAINDVATAALAASSITAPTATAAGTVVIAGNASAVLSPVSLMAPTASAAATANAAASAALAPVTLTAPQASATSEIVINASASASLSPVSLTSPTAQGIGTANASAVAPSLNLTAPTASAVGTVQADGAASAALAPVTLTAPNASAFEGIRVDPALLRSVYVRLGRDEPTIRITRDEPFVRIENQSTTTRA